MNVLEVRRRLLEGGVKKRTAAGNPIVVRSLARMYPGLNIYGKSTQDGTPSPENPVPIVSAGDEGEINVEVLGENLADISQVVNIGGSSYVQISDTGFSFTYSEKDDNTRLNRIPCKLKAGKQYICTAELSSNYIHVHLLETEQYFKFGQTFTPNEDVNYIVVYVNSVDPYDTYTVEHFIVNVGDTALSWEPYKQPQSLTVQTPNGLPGIPVVSGGNYTDESGQQWVCDEVDFRRGKYVKRVKKKDLTSDLSWGYQKTVNYGNNNFQIVLTGDDIADIRKNSMSNFLPYAGPGWDEANLKNPKIYASVEEITASFPPDSEINSLQAWKDLLDSIGDCYIYYILATPIETDLTESQMQSYENLHTNRPTTVVSATEGAGLELTYKTKKSLEVID